MDFGAHTLYVRAKDSLLRWGPIRGASFSITSVVDADEDGYFSDVDCNDNDPLEHPNQTWYQDADGDKYSSGNMMVQCSRPTDYKVVSELIALSGDCDDSDAAVNPSMTEIAGNGKDDDCNPDTVISLMGEINNDDFIDISDVILVLRGALCLDLSLCFDPACADINGDSALDISDVILTLRMALGLDALKQCTI